jgi:predicted Zn-dependent protease with MMP-like domain
MDAPERTLSRKELYDLVWSTPILKVADQFGLSDRGLAKICERNQVPVPGRV